MKLAAELELLVAVHAEDEEITTRLAQAASERTRGRISIRGRSAQSALQSRRRWNCRRDRVRAAYRPREQRGRGFAL
jgi:hypothetical protein